MAGKIQPDNLSSMSQLQVTIAFQEPELDDEDLQADVDRLLPQIREIDGVEEVGLVPVAEMPTGAKSIGGIVVGAAKFAVDNSNILKGLVFIGGRLVNGKTLKATFKAPDGREFSGEAGSRSDFEYLMQQAEEFFDRGKQP